MQPFPNPDHWKIDAHHHVWDLAARPQDWLTDPDLSAINHSFAMPELAVEAAAVGVGATVLVQVLDDEDETRDFLALAAQSPLIAAVTGWVDLTAPEVADRLAGLRAGPGGDYLRGIRHLVQDEPDPDWLGRADVRRGLQAVAAAGLVYELLIEPGHLPAAVEAVGAIDGRFVLDHCGKPDIAGRALHPWADQVVQLAAFDTVTCKLSGLVTQASPDDVTTAAIRPYADVVLDAFGPDRVMAGSDWPVCLLAADYRRTAEIADELVTRLNPAEQRAIFADTARRVFQI